MAEQYWGRLELNNGRSFVEAWYDDVTLRLTRIHGQTASAKLPRFLARRNRGGTITTLADSQLRPGAVNDLTLTFSGSTGPLLSELDFTLTSAPD